MTNLLISSLICTNESTRIVIMVRTGGKIYRILSYIFFYNIRLVQWKIARLSTYKCPRLKLELKMRKNLFFLKLLNVKKCTFRKIQIQKPHIASILQISFVSHFTFISGNMENTPNSDQSYPEFNQEYMCFHCINILIYLGLRFKTKMKIKDTHLSFLLKERF